MKNKIKEKVLKEVVDKVIHLKSRNEIIPKVIDLTLAEVKKVIDDLEITKVSETREERDETMGWNNALFELKQKLNLKERQD